MCQGDIFHFLMVELSNGNDRFWSVGELADELGVSIITIYDKVNKLYSFGFLDIKIPLDKSVYYIKRRFRLKKKYISLEKKIY